MQCARAVLAPLMGVMRTIWMMGTREAIIFNDHHGEMWGTAYGLAKEEQNILTSLFTLFTLMIPAFGIWRLGHLGRTGTKESIQNDIGGEGSEVFWRLSLWDGRPCYCLCLQGQKEELGTGLLLGILQSLQMRANLQKVRDESLALLLFNNCWCFFEEMGRIPSFESKASSQLSCVPGTNYWAQRWCLEERKSKHNRLSSSWATPRITAQHNCP